MPELSPYDFTYQEYLNICKSNGYLIFFENETDFNKLNDFLKKEFDLELKLKEERNCTVYDLTDDELREYAKELFSDRDMDMDSSSYDVFHVEAVFGKMSLEERINIYKERASTHDEKKYNSNSIESLNRIESLSRIRDKRCDEIILNFENDCLKLDINNMHAVIEIDTDDDASIRLNDVNRGNIKIIISANNLVKVKQKLIENLELLKTCIKGGKESVNNEIQGYMENAIKNVNAGNIDFSQGGNRTLSYFIDDGKYVSDEVYL
jgi:hypothetical protein